MNDLISRQAVIDILMELITNGTNKGMIFGEDALHRVEVLPSAQQWIPIKWHDCTDEDREKYGFSDDIVAVFDCEMPDDGESILVTTSHEYVNQDMCYVDDGYFLDSGWDWIDDIIAWMPLPEAYEERRGE